jgi:hypothetical protein
VELSRQDLQTAADLPDLLHAAVGAAVGPHQLQVVHDDQAEAMPGCQAARLGSQFQDAEVARVVDVEGRPGELAGGAVHLRPAVCLDAALA